MLISPDLESIDSLRAVVAADAMGEVRSETVGIEVPVPIATTPEKPTVRQELQIFTSTFFAILLAELGDKTQVATLLMSAQAKAPWIVFVGAGLALIATSLIGVLLGRWLGRRVSAKTLNISTGILLLLLSVLMFGDLFYD